MALNILIWVGLGFLLIGSLMLYAVMWFVMFFLLWATVDDGDYVFALLFAAGLLVWSGCGIVVVGMLL